MEENGGWSSPKGEVNELYGYMWCIKKYEWYPSGSFSGTCAIDFWPKWRTIAGKADNGENPKLQMIEGKSLQKIEGESLNRSL